MVGALIMPFPRNAEKYLCLHYVGSLGAELDLCSGEAGLETEWSIVGQGVNPAVTTQAYLDIQPFCLFSRVQMNCVLQIHCCPEPPITYHLGKKKSIRSQNSFQIPELLTASLKGSSVRRGERGQSTAESTLQICSA